MFMTSSDIGGLEHVKEEIFESVIIPMQHPELFEGENQSALRSPPRGVLLHGPPGNIHASLRFDYQESSIRGAGMCVFLQIPRSMMFRDWQDHDGPSNCQAMRLLLFEYRTLQA
jgi:hypothetical protein